MSRFKKTNFRVNLLFWSIDEKICERLKDELKKERRGNIHIFDINQEADIRSIFSKTAWPGWV